MYTKTIGLLFVLMTGVTSIGSAHAETIVIGGTGSALGVMRMLGDAYLQEHPDDTVQVLPSLGSGGGIRAAIEGKIDIAVTARPPNEEEQADNLEEYYLARTPLGFVVNGRPKGANLTSTQIIDIYAGRVLKWPDGTPIRLVLRPESESDYRLVTAAIEGLRPIYDKARSLAGMPVAYTDGENAELLANMPGAFGTMTLSQLLSGRPYDLTLMSLNGISPDVESLPDGAYPLWKDYWLIVADTGNAAAKRFLAFIDTDEAQDILHKTGHLTGHGQ